MNPFKRDEFVYHSTDIHFNIQTFFYQLFIHLFSPFSIILSPNYYAQSFNILSIPAIIFNWLMPSFVWIMLLCVYMSPDYIHGNGDTIYPALLFYLAHRLMVSLKYATLSDSEYNNFMNCKNHALLDQYKRDIQIIEILLGNDMRRVHYEIAAAATRLSISNISNYSIHVKLDNQQDVSLDNEWKRFVHQANDDYLVPLQDSAPKTPTRNVIHQTSKNINIDNSVTCNAQSKLQYQSADCQDSKSNTNNYLMSLVCLSIFNRAGKINRRTMSYLSVMLIMATMTIVLQPFLCKFEVSNQYDLCFYITSVIVEVGFIYPVALFLAAALYDMIRRRTYAIELGLMLEKLSVRDTSTLGYDDNKHAVKCFGSEQYLYQNIQSCKMAVSEYEVSKLENGERPDIKGSSERFGDRKMEPLSVDSANSFSEPDPYIISQSHQGQKDKGLCSKGNIAPKKLSNSNSNKVYPPPRIEFDCSHNVYAFYHIRQLLLNYGLRFRFRLDAIVATLLFLTMLLMAMIVMMLVSSGNAVTDKAVVFRQTIIATFISVSFLICIVAVGASANYEFSLHAVHINHHIIGTQQHVCVLNESINRIKLKYEEHHIANGRLEFNPEDCLELEKLECEQRKYVHIVDSLKDIRQALLISDAALPLRLLHMKLTFYLAYSLFTAFVTFCIYVYTLADADS